jgi:DNA-binding Lrp family transcriptional regulator
LHEYEVFNKLSKLHEVIELHPLFGEYDLIAKIEAKDYENIGQIIIHKIKTIDGIMDTKTLTGTKFH